MAESERASLFEPQRSRVAEIGKASLSEPQGMRVAQSKSASLFEFQWKQEAGCGKTSMFDEGNLRRVCKCIMTNWLASPILLQLLQLQ